MKAQERIYSLNGGVESLSKVEHGLFFDAVQRLGLPNEVKLAAVALYLDFKSRPIGEYNADHQNLEIFLIASVSLAAKAMGDLRTDHEFESKMFVRTEKACRCRGTNHKITRSLGQHHTFSGSCFAAYEKAHRKHGRGVCRARTR